MLYYLKVIIFLLIFYSNSLHSQNLNIVRDAEIENFFHDLSFPIVESSTIKGTKINFYLDKQNYINAFVTSGPKIFITTELLIKTNSVDQIAGVIAHEIGHITGGHLSKRYNAYEDSMFTTMISSILAVGAIAAGSPSAGSAILMGGEHIRNQQILSFSRNQESYADQTAIKLLKKSNYSVKGLYELFEILERKERFSKINPYNQTHPLSIERKRVIEDHIDYKENIESNYLLNERLKLIKAKLIGYTTKKERFNIYYPVDKNSLESWYAKSIHYYLNGDIDKALIFIDKCINQKKENPYFYELKGQILYENGRSLLAINSYKEAIKYKSDEKHFYLAISKAIYTQKDIRLYDEGISFLKKYIDEEDFPIEAWHYLGLYYGKMGKYVLSSLALTEKFLLLNDIKNAKLQLQKAKKKDIADEKFISKINDLQYLIKQKEKEDK